MTTVQKVGSMQTEYTYTEKSSCSMNKLQIYIRTVGDGTTQESHN